MSNNENTMIVIDALGKMIGDLRAELSNSQYFRNAADEQAKRAEARAEKAEDKEDTYSAILFHTASMLSTIERGIHDGSRNSEDVRQELTDLIAYINRDFEVANG